MPPYQWHTYAIPVVASVGSVLVGTLTAIFISSKTMQIEAWLSYLNDPDASRQEQPAAHGATRTFSNGIVHGSNGRSGGPVAGAGVIETAALEGDRGGGHETRMQAVLGSRESIGRGDHILLGMVLMLSLLFAYLSALIGSSDLLGCFLGGLAFSRVPAVRQVWQRQVR